MTLRASLLLSTLFCSVLVPGCGSNESQGDYPETASGPPATDWNTLSTIPFSVTNSLRRSVANPGPTT